MRKPVNTFGMAAEAHEMRSDKETGSGLVMGKGIDLDCAGNIHVAWPPSAPLTSPMPETFDYDRLVRRANLADYFEEQSEQNARAARSWKRLAERRKRALMYASIFAAWMTAVALAGWGMWLFSGPTISGR